MAPILVLEKISKRFGAVVVADGVDLALGEGEALGIIGPNGAGKTTLFGIAAGTVSPDAGRVTFDGADITRLTPERRCRLGLARSFQIPQPFAGMTVFENVVVAAAFGAGEREAAVYDRCAELLARCALADKANRRAGGLTLLDRKRLELARALATRPRVLLLDEVAGGLDRARMRRAGGADQGRARRRGVDRVDRARGACAAGDRRPPRCPAWRALHRRGRPA